MRFASPEYFWLLFCIPLFVGFFIWAYQHKQAALSRFASTSLIRKISPETGLNRQVQKWLLFLLFFFFLILALVRPQFGIKEQQMERKGIDIMVALDISESMLAEDITPSRIMRAKHEIAKFIQLLKGDRIGLIVFAGESFVQCPLTLDYGAARMYLDAVNTSWIQLQGTALGDAIRQSTKAFKSDLKKHKVLVLISDGEDHESENDAIEAAKEAIKEGVVIYTIGIGSESGVPIPMKKQGGDIVYKKDNKGDLVMTRLNSLILEKIAFETRGKFFHAGTNLDLSLIYKEIDTMEKKDLGINKLAIYEERYQIFLCIALLFLVLEFLLSERVKRQEEWRGRFE
jgi:Ca-activated chloride channel family protein